MTILLNNNNKWIKFEGKKTAVTRLTPQDPLIWNSLTLRLPDRKEIKVEFYEEKSIVSVHKPLHKPSIDFLVKSSSLLAIKEGGNMVATRKTAVKQEEEESEQLQTSKR